MKKEIVNELREEGQIGSRKQEDSKKEVWQRGDSSREKGT